jgi:hypothetical protein
MSALDLPSPHHASPGSAALVLVVKGAGMTGTETWLVNCGKAPPVHDNVRRSRVRELDSNR